jgi:hypothetical protein
MRQITGPPEAEFPKNGVLSNFTCLPGRYRGKLPKIRLFRPLKIPPQRLTSPRRLSLGYFSSPFPSFGSAELAPDVTTLFGQLSSGHIFLVFRRKAHYRADCRATLQFIWKRKSHLAPATTFSRPWS